MVTHSADIEKQNIAAQSPCPLPRIHGAGNFFGATYATRRTDLTDVLWRVRNSRGLQSSRACTHKPHLAKLMLLITQIATTAASPALANTPDTTAALNRITPNAYAILSSAHRITPMKRPNTQ